MSTSENTALRFERAVRDLLAVSGYQIIEAARVRPEAGFDFEAAVDDERWLIEVKFYRTERPQLTLIETAAALLATAAAERDIVRAQLIVSASLTEVQRQSIAERYGMSLLDRHDLLRLAQPVPPLFDALTALLGSSKPDDTTGRERPPPFMLQEPRLRYGTRPLDTRGSSLCRELRAHPPGTGLTAWRKYEKLCERILQYLFPAGLHGWHRQKRTSDGLNRFDLVCRVMPDAAFWEFVVQEVNSRYVLFEFKNYAKAIKQEQVLTTEKYLLERALRRVAIVLTRKGATDSAIRMAQGAMREHGKLILVLDDDQLCEMLHMKERGEDPTDYLFDLADDFLLTLPR